MIRDLYAALYRTLHGFDRIPDAEIDEAVRQLLIQYPDDPVRAAAGTVERMQWSKSGREQVKADMVLRVVQRLGCR